MSKSKPASCKASGLLKAFVLEIMALTTHMRDYRNSDNPNVRVVKSLNFRIKNAARSFKKTFGLSQEVLELGRSVMYLYLRRAHLPIPLKIDSFFFETMPAFFHSVPFFAY